MVVTRFAPSPTGLVHLGNVRTALFSWLAARAAGGRFVLRIEDTDAERSEERFVAALMEDLAWLGLDWDEGPDPAHDHGAATTGERGANGPYRQRERAGLHAAAAETLIAAERAYPCFCTAEELEHSRRMQRLQGKPPRYTGTCAHLTESERAARLAEGRRPTLRFRVPRGRTIRVTDRVKGDHVFASDEIGDFVLRRSDTSAAFFFANAIDDAQMGISLVVRGEDHLANTPRQMLILEALGLPVPEYAHLPLIVGDDGAPLSKRNGSASVADLRAQGYLPEAIVNHLARLGHPFESAGIVSRNELAAAFDLNRIGRSAARHDPAQLAHWQAASVSARPTAELLAAWSASGTLDPLPATSADRRLAFIDLVRDNVTLPAELPPLVAMAHPDWEIPATAAAALAATDAAFYHYAETLTTQVGAEGFEAFLGALKTATGARGKGLFLPLRLALSGQPHGPELPRIWNFLLEQIGTDAIAARFRQAATIAADAAPNDS